MLSERESEEPVPCQFCNGSGKSNYLIGAAACRHCHGTGLARPADAEPRKPARRPLNLLMAGIAGGVLFAVVWLLVYDVVFEIIFGPVDNPNEYYLLFMACSWPAAFVYGAIFGPLLAVIFRPRREGLDRRALAAALLVFVVAMIVILASVSWIEFFVYAPLFLTSPLIALLFSFAAYRLIGRRQGDE